MGNEISVEMRLKLEKLKQDAARAGKDINSGLASSVKGLGKTSIEQEEDAAIRQRRREAIARRNRNAALDDADRKKEDAKQKSGPNRIISPLLAGLGLGIPGIGGIAALAQINPAMAGLVASIRLLRFAIDETADAAQRSKMLYARTMQSGFGIGMQTQRESLAAVLGVGENDVYRFGFAVNYLNGKLAEANKVIAESNPTLTKLSWETGVMKKNFEALKDSITSILAPAIESITKRISDSAQEMATAINEGRKKWEAAGEFQKQQQNKFSGFAVERYFKEGDAPLNPSGYKFTIDGMDFTKSFEPKFAKFLEGFKPKSGIPNPNAFMNQMPASSWERMGLIVGGGGGTNYQKDIAKNTAQALQYLSQLPKFIGMIHNISNPIGLIANIPSLA